MPREIADNSLIMNKNFKPLNIHKFRKPEASRTPDSEYWSKLSVSENNLNHLAEFLKFRVFSLVDSYLSERVWCHRLLGLQ